MSSAFGEPPDSGKKSPAEATGALSSEPARAGDGSAAHGSDGDGDWRCCDPRARQSIGGPGGTAPPWADA